jgi:uncharacterized protein (DUF362 family)
MSNGFHEASGFWPCGKPRNNGVRLIIPKFGPGVPGAGSQPTSESAGEPTATAPGIQHTGPSRPALTRSTREPTHPNCATDFAESEPPGTRLSRASASVRADGHANRGDGPVSRLNPVAATGLASPCHPTLLTAFGAHGGSQEAGIGMGPATGPEHGTGTNWGRATRRGLLVGGALVGAGLATRALWQRIQQQRAAVFVARHQRYDGSLVRTIRDGFQATGLQVDSLRGKRVLLKPNLVEPFRSAPHITTHPAIILATAEVFRGWGADVLVGEGPGHVRDTEMALVESGVEDILHAARIPFADLNYEESTWVPNQGGASHLAGFHLPHSVASADLIVSLPKLKTHHWMGMTAAMKNLYGVLPGLHYGWPKNVLHYAGIPQTVFDINASLPKTITVIDGIDCMEGDGPILGTSKSMGLLLISTNPTAADATACRLMRLRPERVDYLRLANSKLGPVEEAWIDQVGEAWQPLAQPFKMLALPHLQELCAHREFVVM